MLDRLLDLILQWLGLLTPFVVVDHYERGVVLRLGKFHRELGPGFHLTIPFGIERVVVDNVVPRTLNLGSQSLVTKDGRQVVVGGIATVCIRDIQKAVLEVEGVDDAMQDACYGAIGALVAANDWTTVCSEEFSDQLTKACRRNAWRFGIEVQRVQLSDLVTAKSLRIHQ